MMNSPFTQSTLTGSEAQPVLAHPDQIDLVTPRLILLQAMSPQIQSIPNSRPGQLLNSITGEVFESVSVCNVQHWRDFVLFRRRELGGGYIDTFDSRQAAEAAIRSTEENPLDYEIVDTARHLCLLFEPEQVPQPVILSCARSQHRFSRTWNTQIQLAGPKVERWSTCWRLSPVRQQNSKGSWYSLTASLEGWADESISEQARELAGASRLE